MIESSRRGFITGLIAFAATAPAIVRAANIMQVKPYNEFDGLELWRIGDVTEEIYGRSPMMDALPMLRDLAVYGSTAYEFRDGQRYHIPIEEWMVDGWAGMRGR